MIHLCRLMPSEVKQQACHCARVCIMNEFKDTGPKKWLLGKAIEITFE